MTNAVRPVEIVRVGRESAAATDVAAAEEPLEIRLDGQAFVVTMRTPGADADLAAGFLLSEQLVRATGRRCRGARRRSDQEPPARDGHVGLWGLRPAIDR